MRKLIDYQSKFWHPGIAELQFDLSSRDEIPKLLIGLQFICCHKSARDKVFEILQRIIPEDTSWDKGRSGMDLWKILVLGTLRLNCNWDYDKVHNIANNHHDVRLMLGHDAYDFENLYALQTIKDNLKLFTDDVLDEINQVVVTAGHDLVLKNGDKLHGSCDSFVVETDVHYPTDSNLLFDAVRKMIELVAIICSEFGISQWRQSHSHILKFKKLLRGLEHLWRSHSRGGRNAAQIKDQIDAATRNYIATAQGLVDKVQATVTIIDQMGLCNTAQDLKLNQVQEYIDHALRQIDQIERRVLHAGKIPHEEKVFSIFQPHTEWISKGKAGVPQELGLKVCVLKDQFGFILNHQIMEKTQDVDIAVSIVSKAKERFEKLNSCSFDKGFYSPDNKKQLSTVLEHVCLPKKGKLSDEEYAFEHSDDFLHAKRKHSAVESAINAIENHGLDRCLDHGIDGFKRYVSLAVLARNIQIIGHIIQQKKLAKRKRAA